MYLAVVTARDLVGGLLTERLVVVGLGATVAGVSSSQQIQKLRRGTYSTYRANLSPVSVTVSLTFCWVDLEESGVMCSFALVEKSLRPASDMVGSLLGWWVVWGVEVEVC